MSSQHYQPINILVTGGAGFIGANFIRHALSNDKIRNVINIDSLTYAGSLSNVEKVSLDPRYVFVQGDIGDETLVANVLRQYQIDTIIHFAAESHVDRSILGPGTFIQTNIVGTFTLLDAARHYWLHEKKWDVTQCRFHHISTDEVFGTLSATGEPFHEKTAYAPNSPYSASKASSDHLVRAYWHTYGLPMTMSHCSNNYGPLQHAEKFIPTVIRSCHLWRPIPIYGDGSNIRDWLYVDDHCSAIMAILLRGQVGESYNIGGNTELSNLTLASYICDLMDELKPREGSYHELLDFVPDRLGHDWRYAINHTKITEQLGWVPVETLDSGMRKTLAFYEAF